MANSDQSAKRSRDEGNGVFEKRSSVLWVEKHFGKEHYGLITPRDNCETLQQLGAVTIELENRKHGLCAPNRSHCLHKFPNHISQCCLCERTFLDTLELHRQLEEELGI